MYVVYSNYVPDCLYWYTEGYIWDGIYCINPDGSGAFEAFCDMTKDGGGWTVFQRRVDDSVDFYRNWTSYVAGCGKLRQDRIRYERMI